MAVLNNPGNATTHHHMLAGSNYFTWVNTNPYVPAGTNWRLKIGSAPFGYNYYLGPAVPFSQLSDSGQKPPLNTRCFATVEWSTDGGNSWSNGGTYSWYTCSSQ